MRGHLLHNDSYSAVLLNFKSLNGKLINNILLKIHEIIGQFSSLCAFSGSIGKLSSKLLVCVLTFELVERGR